MSITINVQPDSDFIYPAWNKLQYLINSTQTAQSGFKIICKVYEDPSGANTLVQVLNLEVVPGLTKIQVSVQDIIQTYIEDVYSILDSATVNFGTQDLLSFRLTFQEYYSGSVQGSVSNSDIIFVSRSAFSRSQWIGSEFSQWQISSDSVVDTNTNLLNGFANNITTAAATAPAPDSATKFLKMVFGQKQQLRFFRDNKSGALTNMELAVYYYGEDFVQTNYNFIAGITLNKGDLYSFDIGSGEIANHTWNEIDDMTPTANDKYMSIYLINNTTGKTASVVKCFEWIPEVCTGYTPYEVHWLNRYGGFDSYTFTAKSRIDTSVNQSTFKNEAVEISGDEIVDKTSKRFVQPFYTQLFDNYTINSQNLYEWEYEGLRDLLTSPEVYIVLDGEFYSIVLESNSVIRNHRTEEGDIFNMTIKVKLDNSEKRQW